MGARIAWGWRGFDIQGLRNGIWKLETIRTPVVYWDYGKLNEVVTLPEESTREPEKWKSYRFDTFEEIVKKGEKYGIFLTLASQYPHDISLTIMYQLYNYLLVSL